MLINTYTDTCMLYLEAPISLFEHQMYTNGYPLFMSSYNRYRLYSLSERGHGYIMSIGGRGAPLW